VVKAKGKRSQKVFEESERLSDATLAKFRKVVEESPGVSQTSVGVDTGYGQSAISAFIRGTQRPMAHQLVVIARVLGVSLDWLTDDRRKADEWDPRKPGIPDVERFLKEFAGATGLSPAEAAAVISDRVKAAAAAATGDGSSAETPPPRVHGTHAIEPVQRGDGEKAGKGVRTGRALGKKKGS